MIRSTAFVHLVPDGDPDVAEHLIEAVRAAADELDVLAVDAARTAVSHRAGDVMLLAAFRDLDTYETARRARYVETVVRPLLERCAAHVESVRYEQGSVDVQEPWLADGVHRTLLVHVETATDPATVAEFERTVAAMPRYIDAIRNSSVSRVDEVRNPGGPVWTHVWEQEFRTLDGLTGPYMQHAYHWAFIDPWFDPQSPRHAVDTTLVHSACELRRSILALAPPLTG